VLLAAVLCVCACMSGHVGAEWAVLWAREGLCCFTQSMLCTHHSWRSPHCRQKRAQRQQGLVCVAASQLRLVTAGEGCGTCSKGGLRARRPTVASAHNVYAFPHRFVSTYNLNASCFWLKALSNHALFLLFARA